ncbi:hypothetical protein CEY15_12730 [Dietzia natronolimnaea]|uniref:Lipoprotein n=1 Tax=Dietzia natronolimnaea TaxID=161920 RepID=A0A2A2WMX0_9ACTN|nr:hypothetical protein CEY15_12730 [Dietzia natronolimnaea]
MGAVARFRSLYPVLAPPVLLAATACAGGAAPTPVPSPPTSTGPIGAANVPLDTTIDVPGSRAALEAGQAEIRRVLEGRIGADGWREARAAQEVACPSRSDAAGVGDTGIGKYYAREMRHPDALDPTGWDQALDEVVRAVEPHGFRLRPTENPEATDEASTRPEIRYIYLVNDHQDELTLSTHPTIGTGYGGFGVCHPWGD